MAIDNENSSVGTDSFLDVITNFVGILIILVIVVGQNARNAPLPVVEPPVDAELEAARAEAATVEQDVHSINAQMKTVHAELAARAYERDQVQTVVAAVEHELTKRRAALDEAAQQQFDVERDLALAEEELAKLKRERADAEAAAAPQTITVESYPTPISKRVDGREAHFQLSGGRLAFVPFDALIERLRATMRDHVNRMTASAEFSDTLGPIGGFRMRYVIERHDVPQGTMLQLSYVELQPTSPRLGEPVEEALAQGSRFREKLAMVSPDQYTITVWTYPDSFSEFRLLKKELYAMGYAVAGRPLPEGMPIGASPHGSKSSAE
ncbi:MAG: hypothetical protein AB7O59_19325 [Pirellulales bacterium]